MTSALSANLFEPVVVALRNWRQMHGTDDSSYMSAIRALPRICGFVHPITYVIDLGCGHGQWLAAFRDVLGCKVLGFNAKRLRGKWLDQSEYRRVDLSKPHLFDTTKADLAMSLEVAEHLPPQAGKFLVMNLCNIAPAVLFSAATPGQGGWGHVNEQPHEYWDEQFAARGYRIATKFNDIEFPNCPWYRQNMRLYLYDKPNKHRPHDT